MMNLSDTTGSFLQPGPDRDRLFRLFFWMVFIGSMAVYGWGIWSVPLLTHNEARRLVVLRELLQSGDWLIPTKNGQIYLQKPPLFTWFGAVFGVLSGSSAEWVLRLPAALSGFGASWLLFFRLQRHIGRWAALFGTTVLVTSYFFAAKARLAELNILLVLCVFAALLCFYDFICDGRRRDLYLTFAALGLAFMTKGPVALLFFIPPVLIYGIWEKDRRVLRALISARGWLLFALIAIPWYLYVNLHLDGFPMLSVIRSEVSAKVVEESHRPEPFYYYVRHLLGAFAPWVLLAFYHPLRTLREMSASKPGRFFGLAALVPLLIFSLMDYKRDKYILPMYPAMAVCFGIMAARWCDALADRGRRWVVPFVVWGSALLMVLSVVFYGFVQPRIVSYRFENLKPLAARIDQLRGEAPVFYLGEEPIQLIYYYGRPIPGISVQEVADFIEGGRPFFLLVKKKEAGLVDGLPLQVLDETQPYLSRRGAMLIMQSPAGDGSVPPGTDANLPR
jgi:4-amino-4-deoxy-L-arabinose transferase-like glycosyltransferase